MKRIITVTLLYICWLIQPLPVISGNTQPVFLASGYNVQTESLNTSNLARALNHISEPGESFALDSAYALLCDFGLAMGNSNYALQNGATAYEIVHKSTQSPVSHYLSLLRYSTALEAADDNETALNLWIRLAQRMEQIAQPDLAMASLAHVIRLCMRKNEIARAARFLSTVDTLYISSLSPATRFEMKFQAFNLKILSGDAGQSSEFNVLASMVLNEKHIRNQVNLLRLIDAGIAAGIHHHNNSAFQRVIKVLSERLQEDQDASPYFAQLLKQRSDQTNFILNTDLTKNYLQKIIDQQLNLSKNYDEAVQLNKASEKQRLMYSNLISGAGWMATVLFVMLIALINYRIIKQFRAQNIDLKRSIEVKLSEIKRLEGLEGNTDLLIEEKVVERIEAIKNELELRKQIDNELIKALSEAEKANFQKNAFLANMSHEIRTPLNGILGFAVLLQNELALHNKNELFDYAQSIERSGERLLHLLNNIIDISRLEANDLEIRRETCSLKAVLEQVIGTFQFRTNEKGLKLVTDFDDCAFVGDMNTLPRVFNELMDNALKYTEKGFIKLSSRVLPELQKVEIRIQDTGSGIDPAFLDQIFNPFRQDSLGYSKQYQGPGLGIPLTRKLVERMGGAIDMISEKSVGTTVILQFSLAPNDTPGQENNDAAAFTKRAKDKFSNALIIEDDASSRLILNKLLEKHMKTESAVNGDQAVQMISDARKNGQVYDLIMMDINLPAPWDGVKLKDHIINNFTEYKDSIFIAQTAYAMEGDQERFLKAGFHGYLSKPISRKALLSIIDQLSA